MFALRDNLDAVAQGAAGATRILGEAAAKPADLPVLAVSAADTYDARIGHDIVIGDLATTSGSYVVSSTITVNNYSGSVRYLMTHRSTAGSPQDSDLRVKKNGVILNTWATTSTTPVLRTIDITVAPGDVITWEHRAENSATSSVTVAPTMFATNAYLEQPLLIQGINS